MRQRIAVGVQYDGRDWHGWQSQPDGHTVQDQLERALSQFADQSIRVNAAGRTDRGVHALAQVAHFESDAKRSAQGWVRGTNSLLPADIALLWSQAVPEDFHARFSAISRTYHYVLECSAVRSPHCLGRAGWCHTRLDLAAMRAAAQYALGEHDFTALRSSECQARSPVKTVHELDLIERLGFIIVRIRADAFLHHMVRNLVGCLMAVGRGRERPEWLGQVIEARDRSQAAPTFMPDGLYLSAVEYPASFAIPPGRGLDAVFPGLASHS